MAYCVGTQTDRVFEMRDFLCCLDPAGRRACLALMMQRIRALDVDSVSFCLYSDQSVAACFRQLGFRPREFESVLLHSQTASTRFPDQITRAERMFESLLTLVPVSSAAQGPTRIEIEIRYGVRLVVTPARN
jgi:hypothetical protein